MYLPKPSLKKTMYLPNRTKEQVGRKSSFFMVTIYIRIWTIKPTSRQMMIIYRTYERTWAAPEETVIGRISLFFFNFNSLPNCCHC